MYIFDWIDLMFVDGHEMVFESLYNAVVRVNAAFG